MGRLTEDMTRLRSEIGTLRQDRETFVDNLKRNVAALLAGFHAAQRERRAYVSGIRRNVADLLTGFADDIQGAHQAWAGPSFAGHRTTREGLDRPDKKHNPRKTR